MNVNFYIRNFIFNIVIKIAKHYVDLSLQFQLRVTVLVGLVFILFVYDNKLIIDILYCMSITHTYINSVILWSSPCNQCID